MSNIQWDDDTTRRAAFRASMADKPLAVDELRRWLEYQGFGPMQTEVQGDGYFTAGTGKSAWRMPGDEWERAQVRYRGGGLETVKRQLEAVAAVLDALGVIYDVEQRDPASGRWYPALTVALCEEMWRRPETDEPSACTSDAATE